MIPAARASGSSRSGRRPRPAPIWAGASRPSSATGSASSRRQAGRARQALRQRHGRRRDRHDRHGHRDRRAQPHRHPHRGVQQRRHGGRARRARALDQEVRRADRRRQLRQGGRSLNVAAIRVEKPADIVPAIKEAVDVTRSGAPFLLEMRVKEGYDSRYPLAAVGRRRPILLRRPAERGARPASEYARLRLDDTFTPSSTGSPSARSPGTAPR